MAGDGSWHVNNRWYDRYDSITALIIFCTNHDVRRHHGTNETLVVLLPRAVLHSFFFPTEHNLPKLGKAFRRFSHQQYNKDGFLVVKSLNQSPRAGRILAKTKNIQACRALYGKKEKLLQYSYQKRTSSSDVLHSR